MALLGGSAWEISIRVAAAKLFSSSGRLPAARMRGERIPFLDALRGILALTVVGVHVAIAFGSVAANSVGGACVSTFFAMSGYVLARAYDGYPMLFMARRIVRLWPVYAVTLTVGYAALGRLVPLNELIWVPSALVGPPGDPPAWSLYWEAWATLLFPASFLAAAWNRTAFLALTAASASLILVDHRLGYVMFFLIGVAAAQFKIRWPNEIPRWALWLGKVSYSLYLSHAVVMRVAFQFGGAWGVVASLPVVFVVAWLVWRWIERPSIRWSRLVGKANDEQAFCGGNATLLSPVPWNEASAPQVESRN